MDAQGFQGFVKSLLYFDEAIIYMINGFSDRVGTRGIDALVEFPSAEDQKTAIDAEISNNSGEYAGASLGTYYRHAQESFSTLRNVLPNVTHRRANIGVRIYSSVPVEDRRTTLGFDAYDVFKAALDHCLVPFPKKFEIAYTTLTNGMWNGEEIYEGEYGATPGSPLVSMPSHLVRVRENSEEDTAFAFFSALGFFDRTVPTESGVNYLLKDRRVSLERLEKEDYTYPKKESAFHRYCTDQELLEQLDQYRKSGSVRISG